MSEKDQSYFDRIFEIGNSKINTRVKLTKKDAASGMKIFCQEDYAQDLYNMMSDAGTFNVNERVGKDLLMDEIYAVKLTAFNSKERLVTATEFSSGSSVFIPVRELINDTDDEINAMVQENAKIKVIVYKNDGGEIYASERRCAALTYRQDMDELHKNNQPFTVKIVDMIDNGGYIALYRNSIKCFLPGSQAAANVIYDFSEYIGKELPVMIENFDSSNNLYIVSYKKYIKHTLPQKIHELNFGKKYTGTLTANPYDFGIFVEWQNYFTGLIHVTEFGNDYQKIAKEYRQGSKIEFYVKDISFKKGEPRIILTLNKELVNRDRIQWQEIKQQAEGKTLEFAFDKEDNKLEVFLPDDTVTYMDVDVNKYRKLIQTCTKIRVEKVDVIRQYVNYGFVK